MSHAFSELIGNGSQEAQQLAMDFQRIWKGRGVLVELRQEAALVSRCVDRDGEPFEATVTGRILRGRSVHPTTGVVSLFVLTVSQERLGFLSHERRSGSIGRGSAAFTMPGRARPAGSASRRRG